VETESLSPLKERISQRLVNRWNTFITIKTSDRGFEGMRLAVSMREVVGKPVAFENIDGLKSYLMQLIKGV